MLARGPRSADRAHVALAGGVAGGVGIVLGGPLDTLLGIYLAVAAVILLTKVRDLRRLASIVGIVAAITIGVVVIRSAALADGLKFLGIKQGTGGASTHIQSYRQRALLAYIGGRIFIDHPLLGVGWEGSTDPYAFDAVSCGRAQAVQPARGSVPLAGNSAGVSRMPTCRAWPTWASSVSSRSSRRCSCLSSSRSGAAWVTRASSESALPLLVLGVWNGYGLVAGIPLAALTWLAVGVAGVALVEARTL